MYDDHRTLVGSANGRTGIRDMVLDLASRVDGLVIFGRTVDDEVAEAADGTLTVEFDLPMPSLSFQGYTSAAARRSTLVARASSIQPVLMTAASGTAMSAPKIPPSTAPTDTRARLAIGCTFSWRFISIG